MFSFKVTHHALLFWVGLAGIVFYVVAPIVFPDVPNLRQPELLPVYTLMLGLGQLLKGNTGGDNNDDSGQGKQK